ncbi:helix-turn-helix domain-containing protein [Leifsonia aquatica]|uniref:helix-turn-helix domain-containing protein n=1 Tax=Leifsonia aquatica TaxID=144185 RepID=UPI0009DF976D
MNETGTQADARRLSVLLRRDGVVLVPPRLAPWIRSLAVRDVGDLRRITNGSGNDILDLLDALSTAPQHVSVDGHITLPESKILLGDAPGTSAPVSTRAAAERMGLSERTVTRMLVADRLFGWKLGRVWVVPESSIEQFLNGKGA